MSSPSAKACFSAPMSATWASRRSSIWLIVGRDQLAARRGDEGAADLAPFLVAHGDVLQVGVGRRQPPGGGRSQRVGGVDALGARIDEARQRVGVGRFQLGELAPVEDARRQLVALLGEILEHARRGRPGAGRGLLAARQAHLAEQDVAELLGRAEVERRADQLLHLGLDPRHALGEFARQAREHVAVDRHAALLHPRQRQDHRPLERLVDRRHALGGEARLERAPQPQRHVGVLGGVLRSPCRSRRARSR